jgi:hypothetical protein
MSNALSSLRLQRDAFGRLKATLPDGETVDDVVPVRAFPFSAHAQWVSLCTRGGREVLCLPDLGALSPQTRDLLLADLAEREFVPAIQRIVRVISGGGSDHWTVKTDRGDTQFQLPSEDNVRRMGDDGALIIDAHGIRYQIVSIKALDAPSRRFLRQYL